MLLCPNAGSRHSQGHDGQVLWILDFQDLCLNPVFFNPVYLFFASRVGTVALIRVSGSDKLFQRQGNKDNNQQDDYVKIKKEKSNFRSVDVDALRHAPRTPTEFTRWQNAEPSHSREWLVTRHIKTLLSSSSHGSYVNQLASRDYS